MSEQYKILDDLGRSESQSIFAKSLRRIDVDKESDYNPPLRRGMGYVFITRPWLHLSYNNLASYRRLMNAYSDDLNTIASYVRLTLDPLESLKDVNAGSELVDSTNPWIPVLTNCIETCNGWPDRSMDFKVSEEGRLKETYTVATGTGRQYGSFPLNMDFRASIGNPIGALFNVWIDYIGEQHSEDVIPREDALLNNFKDYDVGIWRLVMDSTGKRVESIAWTIGFPTVDANGADLNYDKSKLYQDDNQTYSVSFQCDGLYQNDPKLPELFNVIGGLLDQTFVAGSGGGVSGAWTKVESIYERRLFTDLRPWINTETMELEFYVRTSKYSEVMGA